MMSFFSPSLSNLDLMSRVFLCLKHERLDIVVGEDEDEEDDDDGLTVQ